MKAITTLVAIAVFGFAQANYAHAQNATSTNMTAKTAEQYVEVGSMSPSCGNGGKTPYVKNKHSSKKIDIKLKVTYLYKGQQKVKVLPGNWRIAAGKTHKLTTRCTIPGPTSQKFSYSVHSATYM
ncbi:hypothetical protein EXU30_10105 [Shewanella maritima]|uniref:Uncharacterized protein n=1 Tax=Shewanella maritima TaxID=2520507 RepID=A0A411PHC6_9GAMM|nr:hypothetical protein [Shewanella maritima]QBF83006.1 hypothetical protein EXU30_10105 [Shewanella maritima]